ncbi:MAG: hypothetical protein SFY66_15315 [Oculatellaceae cyanobacterium bins.114]|nr:hypothetical protein [Oculatellaceae cyanobacterium bins.114]
MSSSNPYQSRLFKFVVQQTRQLRDRSLQTWRQFRLGTIWGAQIALYPIYAAFQATRLVGKQLRQVVRQTAPRLKAAQRTLQKVTRAPEPTSEVQSDTPIKQTLAVVQAFALPVLSEAIDEANLLTPPIPWTQQFPTLVQTLLLKVPPFSSRARGDQATAPSALIHSPGQELATVEPDVLSLAHGMTPTGKVVCIPSTLQATADQLAMVQTDPIRGIATLLTTRKLVFITEQNHILDILTPEQDDYLRRCIIGAIANYWRYWRQLALPQPSQFNALPPLSARPNALPPVRSFYEVMRWMQYSPVAIAVNLFNEAVLTPVSSSQEHSTDLENPHDPWEETTPASSLTQFLQGWFRQQPSAPTNPTADSTTVPALPSRAKMMLLEGSRRIVPAVTRAVVSMKTTSQELVATKERIVTQSTDLAVSAGTGSPLELTPLAEIQIQPADGLLSHRSTDKDAIDIQATLVAYVKHPLQQVLEWIDLGMLWLEKRVMQLVSWLRRS